MDNPKIGIVTQARMGSTRFPGKVMKPILDDSMLSYHIGRLQEMPYPVIVATTIRDQDDRIARFCEEREIPYVRGSEEDVLSRYVDALRAYDLDAVVRVTSDCPFLDPDLIEEGVTTFLTSGADYVSNNYPERTFPHGLDFQIVSRSAILEANEEATSEHDREHVLPYVRNSDDYEKKGIQHSKDRSEIRITVDYPEDLALARKLVEEYEAHELGWREIVEVFDDNPELRRINIEHATA